MHKPVPVLGFQNENVLALSINFSHCKQVVSMAAHISKDKKSLKTLWLDAQASKDPQGDDWSSNIIGSDDYTLIN